jgi:hypothetical protein
MSRDTEAIHYIHELLDCTELNMDDMEPETVELIEEIHDWLDRTPMPAGTPLR